MQKIVALIFSLAFIAQTSFAQEAPKETVSSTEEIQNEVTTEKGETDPKINQELLEEKIREFQMMQNFFCYIGTQKYLAKKSPLIKDVVKNQSTPAWKKLLASVYSACQEDMLDEKVAEKVMKIESKEQADQINFPFYDSFDLKKFLDEKNFDMTEEDKVQLKTYEKVQTQFEDYKKKDKKVKKEKKIVEDDEEDVPLKKKKKVEAIKYSIWITIPVFAGMLGLFYFLAKFALKEPAPVVSNKDKKKKKKDE